MPERPDLRQIAGNIREALADYDRDALLEILTYVFKEYVVEGPPPLLVNQSERLEDLAGLSFAQLVSALQTRLDYPELSLFSVDGEQVSVRVGGVMTPLAGGAQAAAAASAAAEAAPPPAAPAPAARPQPGVQVVETEVVRRPNPPPAATPAAAEARRPTGLSVRGRPSSGGAASPSRAAQPAAPAQPQAAPSGQPSEAPATKEPPAADAPDGDDASVRFSLLELD